jgi:DNA primase
MNSRISLESVMSQLNEPHILAIREDIARKRRIPSCDVSHKDLVYAAFGPKYRRKGNDHLFNAHVLVEWLGEGKRRLKNLPYVIVVEAEASALALNDLFGSDGGYLAVAAKPFEKFALAESLRNVRNIYLAYDADEAGQTFVEKARKQLPRARVIPMIDSFNDPNDIVVAGKAESWLSPYSITPVERKHLELPTWS